MADDDAFLHNAPFVKLIRTHLAEHLKDGLGRCSKIIVAAAVTLGQGIIMVFKVGKIDLDLSFKQPQGLHPFITACIIDDGDRKGWRERWQDDRQILRSCHKVNIIGALVDERLINGSEAVRRHFPAMVFCADFTVLTVDAVQRAARKENRAAAAFLRVFPT